MAASCANTIEQPECANASECRWQTWRAMKEVFAAGRTRAIGVSNFLRRHLDDLNDLLDVVQRRLRTPLMESAG